jgi:hypothetical protein
VISICRSFWIGCGTCSGRCKDAPPNMKNTLTLREIIDRCRRLALLARHPEMREELVRLANEMERDVGAFDRKEAGKTGKIAS